MKFATNPESQTFGKGKGRKIRYKKGSSKRKRSNQKYWTIAKTIELKQEHSNCSTCVLSFFSDFKHLFPSQNTDSGEFLQLVNFVFNLVLKTIQNCEKDLKELDFLDQFLKK